MTVRSFSLGRQGEAQWEQLRGAYVLSRHSGEIMLVASDSRDVRDEVRRRLEAMAPRVEVIEPGEGVTLAIHACVAANKESGKLPVAWIEAPASSPSPASDMQWLEALAVLNQTRDALQMHGPCHVVLAGPQALHRVVMTRAPDLASFMSVALLLDDTLENLVTQQGSLTWMHLSDLHVQSESWQQDHVLGGLVRDLPKLLEERELRPDLLFVTGDVAARGQRTEYDGAFIVLEKLTKLLGLDRRQHVFVVPGNHDVDQGRIGRLAQRDHASLLKLGADELRDAVGELLGDAKEFMLYGERLGEWCAFTEKLLGRARSVSPERPWRCDVVDVGGLPVGVLSLCTAWASGPDDHKDSLILGERQLHDMLSEARDGGARLTVALMHHPLHWLHDGEHSAVRGRLEREVDIVLHGHVHEAHSARHEAAGSAYVELGAGAAYAGLGQDPYHGFSVGRLDFERGKLDVHHFTWSTRSGKWHSDAGAPGADDHGRVSLPFTPAGIATAEPRKSGHEVLTTRLRHAAAKVYATVDFAGLGAGGPRKHVTLEQIFVPLRLAAKGLDSPEPSWFEGDVEEEIVYERGEPDDDIPADDPEIWRGRYDAPEGGITDVWSRVSGRVTLQGLEAMLAAGRKIVVLGGPGSGKSTLTRYLASTMAQREGGPAPLLLTVRDWIAEGKHEHLLDMAARQATTSLSIRTDRAALEALCDRGRVVLLVDGVDEAADPKTRRELRDQVHGFVIRFPRVPMLVTSRIAGHHEVPLDDDVFDELSLEPFDDEAIEEFVRRWYDLVEDDPAARLRKRVDLLHAFEVEPRAKELARNPLLATLIGMVHFSHAQLPGDRAKLYGIMIELLLVTWPAERGRELPGLHGTVQQPMLEKLALQLQEQRATTGPQNSNAEVLIDVADLEDLLAERLTERFIERGAHELRHLARQWGKWLVERSGLLQEQQPGRVGFLHLSLMEFLAGRALLEQQLSGGYAAVANIVAERNHQAVWNETLLLMLGSESSNLELGQAVMERLLKPGSAPTRQACSFGLRMLTEEVQCGSGRLDLIETILREISTGSVDRYDVSGQLGLIARFSRAHGPAIQQWFANEVSTAKGDRLISVLAMAGVAFPQGALTWKEVEKRLTARPDKSSVVLTLLDCGPDRIEGNWARAEATGEIFLSWANKISLTRLIPRSLESLAPHGKNVDADVWSASLLFRTGQIARTIKSAAVHPSPEAANWRYRDQFYIRTHLCPAIDTRHGEHAEALRATTSPIHAIPEDCTKNHVGLTALSITQSMLGEKSKYVLDFLVHYTMSALFFPSDAIATSEFQHYSASTLANQLILMFPQTAPFEAARFYERMNDTIAPQNTGDHSLPSSSTQFWHRLNSATIEDEVCDVVGGLLATTIAEVHAGIVAGFHIEDPLLADTVVSLRIQNRWINLFFTPLVEYATKFRPLTDEPEFHALLLTYGLVQYQTTWSWPDCPYWRSWFAASPPDHWLAAHVWHLVRSIQDPTDPSHRANADASLDRNDFPELAQALRDTTVIPTPPEVLARFAHGSEPSAPDSSTPTSR